MTDIYLERRARRREQRIVCIYPFRFANANDANLKPECNKGVNKQSPKPPFRETQAFRAGIVLQSLEVEG